MDWQPITKENLLASHNGELQPNLTDYEKTRAAFSWDDIAQELNGLPEGRGLNIAYEAVDRHANGARRDHPALRWLGRDGSTREFTFGDLQAQSNRMANVLRRL